MERSENSSRIQISISTDLLSRLDVYAKEHYTSRSGVITQAVTQLMLNDDIRQALSDMAISMRRIADNNGIDEQSQKELEQFEAFCKLVGKAYTG